MKRRIHLWLCVTGVIALLLTAALTLGIYFQSFQNQVFYDLKTDGIILAESYQLVEKPDDLDRFKSSGFRITLISADGRVLYDSSANEDTMDNHSTRPEFTAAIEDGEGTAVRHSDTIHRDVYYYAKLLENGEVLRVARESSSIFAVFFSALPFLLLLAAGILLLCFFLAGVLTKRIVAPIDAMAADMDAIEENTEYEELIPFSRTIHRQNGLIRRQLEDLRQEQEKIQALTSNMSEGFLLLDMEKRILSVNGSAVELMGESGGEYVGQNLLYFSRNQELLICVEQALENENASVEITLGGRRLQIIASLVESEGKKIGLICLILDITEKSELEQMRREFTANVSHELKTPLTSISGFAELIESGMAKPADVRKFASKIHTESARLLTLIGDIIMLSELDEAPKRELEAVDLCPLVQKCTERLQAAAERAEISLSFDGESVPVLADPAQMEDLVMNLCDNAIRYNRKGGSVAVTLKRVQDRAVLTVKDTGIGIPPEHQSRIFERFYRVDKSRSKETGGTGLGLAIVKHIAEQHHAKLTLHSVVDEGTEIKVSFPLCEK